MHLAALVVLLSFCAVALGTDAGSSAVGDHRCPGAIAHDDVVARDDVILARVGNDSVRARGGDDKVCGNHRDSGSGVDTKDIDIARAGAGPQITTTTGDLSYTENDGRQVIDTGLTVTHADSAQLSGATVSVTGNFTSGEDTLAFTNQLGITGSYDSATGVLTLSGPATVANYRTALRRVTYANGSDTPSTSTRTISFQATDTDATAGNTATRDITINAVNDAPKANTDTFFGIGNTGLFAGTTRPAGEAGREISRSVLENDTDPDSASASLVAEPVTDAPTTLGGTITIQSDGSFTYHPDDGDTGGTDTFTYRVCDASPCNSGTDANSTGTLRIPLAGEVWYVKNNAPAGGDGTSDGAFDTIAEADAASGANDTVFVFDGDNTTTGHTSGYTMNAGERLLGEVNGLTLDPDGGGSQPTSTLHAGTAAAYPALTNSNADVISLASGASVRGFEVNPEGSGGGITGGAGVNGGTIGNVKVLDTGTPGSQPGVELDGTAGTFNFSDLTVSTKGATGVRLMNAGTTRFTPAGTISVTSTGAKALEATGTNMGSGSVFDAITVTGSGSGGVDMTSTTGTTRLGDGSGTDLALASSGATPAFRLSSAGTVSVPDGGIANVAATGGPAIDITGTTAGASGFSFDDVDSTGSASDGVNLSGLGAGSFAANSSSSISGAAGISFDLDGGSGSVSFAGTFNNGPGQTAEITGRSGGAVVFSGAVNDTSDAGGGISLSGNTGGSTAFSNATKTINTTTSGSPSQNNAITMLASAGHTLDLTGGGLNIDSTGRGLQANSSGTLRVTGPGNSINSRSGIALDVSNTNIGAPNLNFERIDAGNNTAAADPTNGIVLSNTGSAGRLIVSGSGGTCTNADSTGCSGGRIQHTTGVDSSSATPPGTGIVLNNTSAPSFTRVHIHDHSNYGIRGAGVNGFTLANSVINGTNGTSASDSDSSVYFNNASGIALSGSASVTSTHIQGGLENNFWVSQTAGVLDRITFNSVTIGPNSAALGNAGIMLEGLGTTTMNATVQNTAFTSTRATHFQMIAGGTGGGDLDYTGNTVSNNHPAVGTGGGGVLFQGGAGGGTFDINVSGANTFRDALGHAVIVEKNIGSGSITGAITGAQIGVAGTANSGSVGGDGLKVEHEGGGNLTLAIANNAIREYNNFGMELKAGDGIVQGGNLNLTVTGNTVANPGSANAGVFQGIALNNGVTPGDSFQTCLHLKGNNAVGSGRNGGDDLRVRARQSTSVRLPGYGGPLTDTTAIATFLANQNDANPDSPGADAPVPTASAARDAGASFSGTGTTCP